MIGPNELQLRKQNAKIGIYKSQKVGTQLHDLCRTCSHRQRKRRREKKREQTPNIIRPLIQVSQMKLVDMQKNMQFYKISNKQNNH